MEDIVKILKQKVINLQKNKEYLGFSLIAKPTDTGFYVEIKNLDKKYQKALDKGISDIIRMAGIVIEDTLYPRYAQDKREIAAVSKFIKENQTAYLNTLFICGEEAFEAMLLESYDLRKRLFQLKACELHTDGVQLPNGSIYSSEDFTKLMVA